MVTTCNLQPELPEAGAGPDVEESWNIDFDATLAALDALEARQEQPQETQLRALGAPVFLWEDLHVCVSNASGACERCLHPRAGM